MSSPQTPRIAIVGGGPGGLTLGVLLHKRNIPFTIYELRPQPTDAELTQPAGMLDLHEESGLAALRACGLYEAFLPLTGECADETRIADSEGTIVHDGREPGAGAKPEISRPALSHLLLSALPPAAIRWNQKLVRATKATDTNEIQLDFGPAHGIETADLVVGADGAWSRVRPLLTETKSHYSGLQHITLTIAGFVTRHPQLAALVGPGTFLALGGRKGIVTQSGARGSLRIYILVKTPDEDFLATRMGLADLTPLQAKDRLLGDEKLFGKWGVSMRELIACACEEDQERKLDMRGLYTLPAGKLAWKHTPGVTLLGDAAHLMPPSGEGVNLAMLDALELAEAVGSAYKQAGEGGEGFQKALEPLMKHFEHDMDARSEEKLQESLAFHELMYGHEDGARHFMAAMGA
ncbi:salicylate hydroxylase [Mycena rebaudengoi]|nr:salicylate hydroxylase [Mycena rebaudengoi]